MQSVEPGFDPVLLLDPVQVAEPDCRRRYSTDIDDWDRDDRAKMQMRVLVRVDVNGDEHDAVIDFAQLVPEVTVKLW